MPRKLIATGLVVLAAACIAFALQARLKPSKTRGPRAFAKVGEPGEETKEAANAAEQMRQARTAPGIVAPGATIPGAVRACRICSAAFAASFVSSPGSPTLAKARGPRVLLGFRRA